VNVLVVGAGGLGLWAVKIAQCLIGPYHNKVRLFVADNSIDKLLTAQDHGCYDIIHWNEEDHEQYIIERTLDACRGGVDVVIDFVSSHRTMNRSLKVLNRVSILLQLYIDILIKWIMVTQLICTSLLLMMGFKNFSRFL